MAEEWGKMKGGSRTSRGAKQKRSATNARNHHTSVSAPNGGSEAETARENESDGLHAHLIDVAVDGARKQARRLHVEQRALFTVALGGLLLVALRGVASVAFSRPTAPILAVVLAVAVVVFIGLCIRAWKVRGRLEHLVRDIQTLDHARESLEDEPVARVEVGPVDAGDGVVRPLVVVRNDSLELLLSKGQSTSDASSVWLGRAAWGAVGVITLGLASSIVIERDASAARRWTFADPSEPAALGFRVVGERSGSWLVEEHSTATGAHALTNRAGDHGSPPATLVAHGIRAADVKATTRCKVAEEREGAACGIVFRFQDDANHHLARLDFVQKKLVVSIVTSGMEHVLGAVPARISAGTWQELTVEVRGDRLRASCNDRDVVEGLAAAPATPGHVGLWVPATGEAYFDELAVDDLPGSSPALAVLPMLRPGS